MNQQLHSEPRYDLHLHLLSTVNMLYQPAELFRTYAGYYSQNRTTAELGLTNAQKPNKTEALQIKTRCTDEKEEEWSSANPQDFAWQGAKSCVSIHYKVFLTVQ